ncbi:hypothetical protein [Fulvimonas soli]|jgi:hypothetical protein|uniref:Uncharacterized protein n=1 Tax=Fulvimonas soli TaxID=155197 RepID=A0A316III6_9GAMM|nr:hypothetical protein [Fulvimonas soli]PWK92903.1 hypothetical protein C7456_101243 [Fulvimonas soli]TNY26621.1 hypothetical protein BV497_07785 [Fulvimonas soli]
MKPETIRLFVPYSTEAPWIVRREVARVGTYASRDEAVSAALAMRLKLIRAWGRAHPPVSVQESDGSWHDVTEGGPDRAG